MSHGNPSGVLTVSADLRNSVGSRVGPLRRACTPAYGGKAVDREDSFTPSLPQEVVPKQQAGGIGCRWLRRALPVQHGANQRRDGRRSRYQRILPAGLVHDLADARYERTTR